MSEDLRFVRQSDYLIGVFWNGIWNCGLINCHKTFYKSQKPYMIFPKAIDFIDTNGQILYFATEFEAKQFVYQNYLRMIDERG